MKLGRHRRGQRSLAEPQGRETYASVLLQDTLAVDSIPRPQRPSRAEVLFRDLPESACLQDPPTTLQLPLSSLATRPGLCLLW